MKRIVALIGLVLLVGMIAFQAQASTRTPLDQRVKRLERQVRALSSTVAVLKTDVSTLKTGAATLGGQVVTLTSRLAQLTTAHNSLGAAFIARTSKLDSSGSYTGNVYGDQVRPLFCSSGQTAVWGFLSLGC